MYQHQQAASNTLTESGHRQVEVVQAEILSIFDHLVRRQASSKARAAAKKRLAARRAIEQHFERKALEAELRDGWLDEA